MGRVKCCYCGKEYFKDIRHINENLKFDHNFFCSPKCQYTYKNKQKEFKCENPTCKNKFKRATNDISPHNFCSHSCSATFSNTRKWGYKKSKSLLTKEERIRIWTETNRNRAKNYWLTHGKDYVISKIQDFVIKQRRIPVKREMWGIYKPARKFFGTWNNAIEAAGFSPNPVLFAKRHMANDGHYCDSLAEKLIDDFLYEKGIKHERCCPYPEGIYTADFKIGEKFIEYFGLAGEHKRYDELRKIKQKLAKRFKLEFIEIYPKDLYPVCNLESVFGNLNIYNN